MTRLVSWLLSRLAGSTLADSILGDLDEEHARRSPASPLRAACWYWREVALVLLVIFVRVVWSAIANVARPDGPFTIRIATDLRHAWRAIWAHRGSSLAIVAVLGLGIGLTSAMFALADPFILRPLPYAKPHELVVIDVGVEGLTRGASVPTVDDWRSRTDLFQGLAIVGAGAVERLRLSDRSTFLVTQNVSTDLFRVLGVSAPETPAWTDAASDVPPVLLTARASGVLPSEAFQPGTVLSHHDGSGLRVIGSLPGSFLFPDTASTRDIQGLRPFVPGPVVDVAAWRDDGRARFPARQTLIARVQRGVEPVMIDAALAVELPSGMPLAVKTESLTDRMTRSTRPLAQGALAAGAIILLICAGNVANLLLARLTFRSRDIATRAALGASRADLARLWLVELTVISALATAMGLVAAWAALAVATLVIPGAYISLGAPSITPRVVIFALVAGSTTVAAGVLPLAVRQRRMSQSLFGHAVAIDSRRIAVFRFASVAMQSALAMILAVGAALLVQSYVNLIGQDSGFDRRALTVTAMYPATLRDGPLQNVIDSSLERLRRIPGVSAVSIADGAVIDGVMSTRVHLSFTSGGENAEAQLRSVSEGYFETAGMRIVAGRGFNARDGESAVVVNEALAAKYWPGGSAVGQVVSAGTIVGIVRDAHEQALDRRPEPTVYNLLSARIGGTMAGLRGTVSSGVTYVLRGSGETAAYESLLRRALFDAYPDVLIPEVDTFGGKLANTVRDRTFATLILTFFGVAGSAVTIAGLVGIVAFVVARRTREIAIRIAIGAQRGHIRSLVTREVITAAAIGGIAGLLIGRWLSTGLESFVYGVEAGNWTTALAAGAVMLTIMAAAALVPARRAVNLSPTAALRVE